MLTKITQLIVKNLTAIALGFIIGSLVLGGLFRSCNSGLERKLGALDESIRIHTQEIKILQETNGEIAEQNKAILDANKELDKKIASNQAAIIIGLKDLKKLSENRPEYPEECREIVAYMDKEIKGWQDEFSLAIKDRDDWKQKSGNNETLYLNEVKISANITLMYDKALEDSGKKDDVIRKLQTNLAIKKFESTLYRIVIIVAGGYVVYKLVK